MRSFGSFHGNMLTSAFGASIAASMATATAARQQVDAYGGPEIRLAQEIAVSITRAIADARLQVVPSVLVGGDGRSANAVDAIAAMVLAGQNAGKALTTRPDGQA